jgi:hypothetical protein
MLVFLLEKGPWVRKNQSKNNEMQLQRYEDGKWSSISTDDLALMTKTEGQIWLSLMNLLLEESCRRKYEYITSNHAVILRVL